MNAYGSVLWFYICFAFAIFSPADSFQLHLWNIDENGEYNESLCSNLPVSTIIRHFQCHPHHQPLTMSFLIFAYISSLTISVWIPKSSFLTQSYHYCANKLNNSLNIIKYLISDRITPIILQMYFTVCSNQHLCKSSPLHLVDLTPRPFYVYLWVSPFFFHCNLLFEEITMLCF